MIFSPRHSLTTGLALCGLVLASICAPGLAAEYSVVRTEKSSIRFVAKQMGVPVEGRFSRFNARVRFDPAKPDQSTAQIDVDLAGIDAGSAEANEEVKGKDWFNIKEIPVASFSATQLKSLGNNRFEASGKMNIKGQIRELTFPLTAKREGADMALEGSLPIHRLQYGIGGGVWSDPSVVADEVQLRFRLLLGAAPATSANSVTRAATTPVSVLKSATQSSPNRKVH